MTHTVATAAALQPAVREALRRQVLRLADGKRLLGLRYSDWLLGAPSLEACIAASSMAQDEWGHARLLYAMLKDVGEDPGVAERERRAGAYCSPPALDGPFADWCAFVVANVVVDGALYFALQGLAEGAYEIGRSRIPKMLAEEEFHRVHGLAWLRRLAGGGAVARARLREECERVLASTLAWLDPADGPADLLAAEELAVPGAVLRERFVADVGPALQLVDVDAAAVAPDRQGWHEARGRGPGEPDEDSVRRARGDKNRALFVE